MGKLLLRYKIIKDREFTIITPDKVLIASREMISRGYDDVDYFIERRLVPYLEFTDSDEDFIQFVELKDWLKRNSYSGDNISSTKFTDALERIFEQNYVKRYRMKKTKKDMNKCLVRVKWIATAEQVTVNMF